MPTVADIDCFVNLTASICLKETGHGSLQLLEYVNIFYFQSEQAEQVSSSHLVQKRHLLWDIDGYRYISYTDTNTDIKVKSSKCRNL